MMLDFNKHIDDNEDFSEQWYIEELSGLYAEDDFVPVMKKRMLFILDSEE